MEKYFISSSLQFCEKAYYYQHFKRSKLGYRDMNSGMGADSISLRAFTSSASYELLNFRDLPETYILQSILRISI